MVAVLNETEFDSAVKFSPTKCAYMLFFGNQKFNAAVSLNLIS